MKVTYTGRQVELAPAQAKKVEAQFAKIGKLLDRKEEREAHVILSHERHLFNAEVTVNYRDRVLVGASSDGDLLTALLSAVDKLESQAKKVREKLRANKRTPKNPETPEAIVAVESPPAETAGEREVFRVNHHANRKPMTLEEALLQMEGERDYLVYRDADTDRTAVLVRRRDGNFDLIES
ncbi:MAG: ribosome-associated translation inhibitor RaiA [Bryobacteraceae bacterium]